MANNHELESKMDEIGMYAVRRFIASDGRLTKSERNSMRAVIGIFEDLIKIAESNDEFDRYKTIMSGIET